MRSGGNNFNYFPENKRTKLANFVQFLRMPMFCLEDWGAVPPVPLPPLATPLHISKSHYRHLTRVCVGHSLYLIWMHIQNTDSVLARNQIERRSAATYHFDKTREKLLRWCHLKMSMIYGGLPPTAETPCDCRCVILLLLLNLMTVSEWTRDMASVSLSHYNNDRHADALFSRQFSQMHWDTFKLSLGLRGLASRDVYPPWTHYASPPTFPESLGSFKISASVSEAATSRSRSRLRRSRAHPCWTTLSPLDLENQKRQITSNLSKAHVTRGSIGAATWEIIVQRAIKYWCIWKE